MDAAWLAALRERCRVVADERAGAPPFPSILAQLDYLREVVARPRDAWPRLADVIVGLQAAREIEPIDEALADDLHEVSAWVRAAARARAAGSAVPRFAVPLRGALVLRRVEAADLATIEPWFADAELSRRVDPPSRAWLAHVHRDAVVARLAVIAAIPVGVAQCDLGEEVGSIAVWIDPARRGAGVGARLLRAFLDLPRIACLRRIDAHIEPDNVASARCFAACGFAVAGPDGDGLVRWSRRGAGHPR